MIREDLRHDICADCGAPLSEAVNFERREVVWASGEFAGPGIALEVVCHCGAITTLLWTANPEEGGSTLPTRAAA